jgi:hypothetical protein
VPQSSAAVRAAGIGEKLKLGLRLAASRLTTNLNCACGCGCVVSGSIEGVEGDPDWAAQSGRDAPAEGGGGPSKASDDVAVDHERASADKSLSVASKWTVSV